MTIRPRYPRGARVARAGQRMAPGGRRWSESPIPRVGVRRVRAAAPRGWEPSSTGLTPSPGRYTLGVAYDGTTWVGVGGDNGGGGTHDPWIMTATDPTGTWTSRTSPIAATTYYDVAFGGGVWVAGGIGGNVATATDPTGTWTERSTGIGNYISGLAYGGSVWVAVGTGGRLYTATDPTGTWTPRTSAFGTGDLGDVAYDGTTWVIVGNDGIQTATNPTGPWTSQGNPFSGTGNWPVQVVTDGSAWVVSSFDGDYATATNPTGTWTLRTALPSTYPLGGLAYGDGYWLAFADQMYVATDPTGTWTEVLPWGATPYPFTACAAFGGGMWVAGNLATTVSTAMNPTTPAA